MSLKCSEGRGDATKTRWGAGEGTRGGKVLT